METLTINLQELKDMKYAQNHVYQDGFRNRNKDGLISSLSTVTGILTTIFNLPTPLIVADAVFSLLAALAPNEKDVLGRQIVNGVSDMDTVIEWFENNPQYDLIKIKMSFLEYPDYDMRFVTYGNTDRIVAAHTDGGWQY